jgi:hypothetical protein
VYFQLGVSGCLFPEVLVASAKLNDAIGAQLLARPNPFGCATAEEAFYTQLAFWAGWELPDTLGTDRTDGAVLESNS